MTVYVDDMAAGFFNMIMCHMVADTEAELEEMAIKIGMNTRWWQYKGTRKTHFDICKSKRALAVRYGAIPVTCHELGFMLKSRKSSTDPLAPPRPGTTPPVQNTLF